MAYVHSHPGNVVRLADFSRALGPMSRIVRRWGALLASVLLWIGSARQRVGQRRVLTRLTLAERSRQRRALAQLSDRELRDIGLSRYDVGIEFRKPFWR